MGVNGLWQVVQPCARPTNLATLNRKRLAVDASIWIYQFLKAVRDKDGNALRNSHVVGFFRRICKLLWFGIKPVFVFDGGAPSLKRQTIQNRKRRREGHREDAVRTAGKLLAVQMQRVAEEEVDKRRRKAEGPRAASEEQEEVLDMSTVVYVDEIGMSKQERQKNRKFHKKDAYHLPDLDGGIANMGHPEDPRIMSVKELEEYARQFNSGQDINLYDFSKIDFESDFFKSLPAPDRYNILNAARLRSRLRMGLSKDQLEDMFPNRMDFSRFQIERVRERNMLTQRLMRELGMAGAVDMNLEVNARIAGEKNREYILVKNEGAEGGWALGVVNKEKDMGESHKPIDVDALQFQYQAKDEAEEEEDDDDEFEDVPIPGLNRLPPVSQSQVSAVGMEAAEGYSARRQQLVESIRRDKDLDESLFVGSSLSEIQAELLKEAQESRLHPEEQADINKAIALSLQSQHDVGLESSPELELEDDMYEDVTIPAPSWTQKSTEAPKPITAASGNMIAHIVNNRANAAVAKQAAETAALANAADSDSDDEVDFQKALAMSRKANATIPRPSRDNVKNPFDGPLPFPKLDWNQAVTTSKVSQTPNKSAEVLMEENDAEDDEMAGGFEREHEDADAPKPLPPWLVDDSTDIRESVKKQQAFDQEMNDADRRLALEEQREYQRRRQTEMIEIDSSDESDSDIEIVDGPPLMTPALSTKTGILGADESRGDSGTQLEVEVITLQSASSSSRLEEASQTLEDSDAMDAENPEPVVEVEDSPEPEFEDVSIPRSVAFMQTPKETTTSGVMETVETEFVDLSAEVASRKSNEPITQVDVPGEHDDYLFGDAESVDGFSDPEEEELLVQMEQEVAEHARFADELNNRSEDGSGRDFDKELRQLRAQQKKDRRDADEVSDSMVAECQALLRLFGVPYITAPMEAEAQCAELVRLGLVDGIVTDDSDTFLFGGTRVYKNMFNNNKFVECYLSQDLEREMSLSREQLIALAQLLGSDYTEGLPGVGPVTAVEILSEFPGTSGLEGFREWWQDVQNNNRPKDADASSPFRKKFRKAQSKKLFLPPGFPSPAVVDAYLKPTVDDDNESFQWGVPDVEGLRQFLMATIGWDKQKTDDVLLPVVKDMNKRDIEGTQTNITRYFQGGVGAGALEAFAPRQRANGSKRMGDAVAKLKQKTLTTESGSGPTSSKRKRTKASARVNPDEDVVDGNTFDDEEESWESEGSDESVASRSRNRSRGKKPKA